MIPLSLILGLKSVGSRVYDFARGIRWQVYAVSLLILLSTFGVYRLGQADVQEKFDEYKATVIKATAVAKEKAIRAEAALAVLEEKRKAEAAIKEAQAKAIDAKYKEELADAKVENDKLVADLKSGNRKLRYYWHKLSGTEKDLSAAELDERAKLQAESAGRIVRAAAEADAQVRGLQAFLESEGYKETTKP